MERTLELPSSAPGKGFVRFGALSGVLLCILFVMNLALGVVTLTPERLLTAFVAPTADPAAAAILFNIRLPRALLACCAGALTALTALTLERIARDGEPHDPGWSGAMSLSALGAVIALTVAGSPSWSVPGALIGSGVGIAAFIVVQRRSQRAWWRRAAGLSIAVIAPALAFALLIGDVRIAAWVRWCLGSLEQRDWQTWSSVWVLLLIAAPVVAVSASQPGLPWMRYAGATLAVATVVVAVGATGWIGRTVARWAGVVAASGVQRTIAAGLLGAVLLLGVDLAARGATALLPSLGLVSELPAGALLVALSIASFLIARIRK
ncbi:MAG: iron chelate uptake ABC transporter family permease subunit [Roseiflexaceae bacterium]|nr:iron chelate uptake ABC transporter family permease subunit [Roseiflexaceae bacterium]